MQTFKVSIMMFEEKHKPFLALAAGLLLIGAMGGAYYLGRASGNAQPVSTAPTPAQKGEAPAEQAAQKELSSSLASTAEKAEEKTEEKAEQPPDNRSAFVKDFEAFLNAFLKDLVLETKKYKKDRRILKEAINPYNLVDTENAEMSYKVFRSEIAPMLRKKSERILSIFERSRKNVEKILEGTSEKTRDSLMKVWESLEKEHIENLTEFFEKEDKIITAYESLLKFYVVHSKLYSVNMETGALVFQNEKHRVREQVLLDKIKKLEKQQK